MILISLNHHLANLCPPNQCSNGKTCSIAGDSYDSFSCACLPGISGDNCEISPCDSFVCENGGGPCMLAPSGLPRCKCPLGFKGNHCQKDLCSPSPCQNGGCGCSHSSGGYGCICPYPWASAFCTNYNGFAATATPLAYYTFSSRNKLIDETGNGYNLSSFNAEPMSYPIVRNAVDYPYSNPMNEALILFGQDIISTSSQTITFGNDFSFSIAFSISKFYLTSTLVSFTPNGLSALSSMSLNLLYDFFFQIFIAF